MTHSVPEPAPRQDAARAAARHAKQLLRAQLAGDRRVNGLAITRVQDHYAVRVNVVDAVDVPDLPEDVDGVPIQVVCVGRISTQ